jgi:phage FluMu protein Com
MEIIFIKCSKCEKDYLTVYKSGNTTCPLCGYVNKILVGYEAVDVLNNQGGNDDNK